MPTITSQQGGNSWLAGGVFALRTSVDTDTVAGTAQDLASSRRRRVDHTSGTVVAQQ
jgi:hypothetical protein